jgi:putative transposase
MSQRRFSESPIMTMLKEVEKGRTVKEVGREYSVGEATSDRWKTKSGGEVRWHGGFSLRRRRALEDENRRPPTDVCRCVLRESCVESGDGQKSFEAFWRGAR